MRDKSDSVFPFRRNSNRYSIALENKASKKEIELKRASWSAFPMLKFAIADESKFRHSEMPTVVKKSQSSEDLKKMKSRFFRASSSVRNLFTGSSGSSASSSSSDSSSPKIRRGSIDVAIIGRDFKTSEQLRPVRNSLDSSQCYFQSARPLLNGKHWIPSANGIPSGNNRRGKPAFYKKGTKSVPSYIDHEEEGVLMNTPKVIFAHRKGSLGNESLFQNIKNARKQSLFKSPSQHVEKENLVPDHRYFCTSEECEPCQCHVTSTGTRTPVRTSHLRRQSLPVSQTIAYLDSRVNISQASKHKRKNGMLLSNPVSNTGCYFDKSVNNTLRCTCNCLRPSDNLRNSEVYTEDTADSITPCIISDESDEEVTNIMASDRDDSCCFEKCLEDNLEALDDECNRRSSFINTECSSCENANNVSDVKEDIAVHLRKKKPKDLLVDIKSAKDLILRRINEEGSDSSGASASPGTRSPVIDIDDVFNQRHKDNDKHSDHSESMSKIKELAKHLKLKKTLERTKWDPSALKNNKSQNLAKHPQIIIGTQKEQETHKRSSRRLFSTKSGIYTINENVVVDGSQHLSQLNDQFVSGRLQRDDVPQPLRGDGLTLPQREENLTNALTWIRKELKDMQSQDCQLAKQLVKLHLEMQRLRLVNSCNRHEALLDEASRENDFTKEFMNSSHIDAPKELRECVSLSLKGIGVTKMNIDQRRFTLR